MAKISIEAKQGVYLTYKNYTYTSAQVFGEYIDNAIQSNEDHKSQLKSITPGHQLRVDINVEWNYNDEDKSINAETITIKDNAAGMTSDVFAHAFNLTDNQISRKGMNEFGVGMKAASAWLGNKWRIESTSIDDHVTRILEVDLTEVATKQIKELESEEIIDNNKKHGTIITISELWKENVIKKDSVGKLIKNIASIYRYFIRNNEIRIYFGDDLLTFEDYPVLKAPSYNNPGGKEIVWKKAVSTDDHNGHTITGFVGLLKDMSDENRGVVFTRNNRVVLGFDPQNRTIGKIFMGQIGSRKYRRVFGELEIAGFAVAFGKNQLNDLDLLESLCKGVAGKLKMDDGTNLLTQGDKYKIKNRRNTIPTPKPTSEPTITVSVPVEEKKPESKTEIQTENISTAKIEEKPSTNTSAENNEIYNTPTPDPSPIISSGTFYHKNNLYSIDVIKCDDSDEIFWNDLSQISTKKLICKINTHHSFFSKYGKLTEPLIAIMKALSISKFKVMDANISNVSEMMNEFNSVIKTL